MANPMVMMLICGMVRISTPIATLASVAISSTGMAIRTPTTNAASSSDASSDAGAIPTHPVPGGSVSKVRRTASRLSSSPPTSMYSASAMKNSSCPMTSACASDSGLNTCASARPSLYPATLPATWTATSGSVASIPIASPSTSSPNSATAIAPSSSGGGSGAEAATIG